MSLRQIILVTFVLLQSVGALASDLDQELHWFTQVLHFARISQKEVQSFLNPFKGPTQFRLDEKNAPWAGNYFPMEDGGIAGRWRLRDYPEQLPSKAEIFSMTAKQLRNLSPVEKYDIMMGYYDFRTTRRELAVRGPMRDAPPENWEGFCNGVRCAGIMTEEPHFPVSVENKDGVKVHFSPADLKALAGASYFYVEKYGQIGGPTGSGRAESQPNPAVFDLALRYHLAENKKGFVIDSHLGSEIWNETVVGFNRRLGPLVETSKSEKAANPAAVRKVRVDVVLDTLGEVGIKESNKLTKSLVADGSLLTTLETGYTLYLDEKGRAIDGRWHNGKGTRGVDFAWFVSGGGADHAYSHLSGNAHLSFNRIRKLIRESAHPQCSKLFM